MNIYGGGWRLLAFKDAPAFYTNYPPCRFHRIMQRLLLGWKWTRE